MGDLTRTERGEFEQLKRDVAALKKLGVSGGLSITRGPGGQMVISGAAAAATGFYAAITGGTGNPYDFAEVVGPAVGSAVVVGGRVSTSTDKAYEQLTGIAGIPTGTAGGSAATVVWMFVGTVAQPWRFHCAKVVYVDTWQISTTSPCVLTPLTTKTYYLSGPNLCARAV